MSLRSKQTKQNTERYIYRFFPQLPENSFNVILSSSGRIMLYISTKEGKLIENVVWNGGWSNIYSSPKIFNRFIDKIAICIKEAGYY